MLVFWSAISPLDDLWAGVTGNQIKNNTQNLINNFDAILLIVYIGLHLGVLVTAYLLRTHPVIYVVSLILIAILAMVAAPISNAYSDIIASDDLNTVSGDIPMTNFIMTRLVHFEVVFAFLTAICLFGFARFEGIV